LIPTFPEIIPFKFIFGIVDISPFIIGSSCRKPQIKSLDGKALGQKKGKFARFFSLAKNSRTFLNEN
jgi:hypothetical protein